jgi:hypothetical protein
MMPEASVGLAADVRGGQERLLSRAKQHQVRREQRAVEHLVEAGASVVVGDLVGVHVGPDDCGLPIGTPARLAHLVQRDGEQPGGELPRVGPGETGPALPGIDKGARAGNPSRGACSESG